MHTGQFCCRVEWVYQITEVCPFYFMLGWCLSHISGRIPNVWTFLMFSGKAPDCRSNMRMYSFWLAWLCMTFTCTPQLRPLEIWIPNSVVIATCSNYMAVYHNAWCIKVFFTDFDDHVLQFGRADHWIVLTAGHWRIPGLSMLQPSHLFVLYRLCDIHRACHSPSQNTTHNSVPPWYIPSWTRCTHWCLSTKKPDIHVIINSGRLFVLLVL